MGHAATATRATVLETAAAAIDAADSSRSLANTVAAEQLAIKTRLDALETDQRVLVAALDQSLLAIRSKADRMVMAKAESDIRELLETARINHVLLAEIVARHSNLIVTRGFFGRLRWLVTGR